MSIVISDHHFPSNNHLASSMYLCLKHKRLNLSTNKKLVLGYFCIQIVIFENNQGIHDFVLRNFLDGSLIYQMVWCLKWTRKLTLYQIVYNPISKIPV
jgi:hypothetical protein